MLNLEQDISASIGPEISNGLGHLFDVLISSLKKEIEVYGELHEVVLHERSVLKRPTTEALNDSNARKETVILKVKMVSEVKLGIAKRIARAIDLDERNIHMTALIVHASVSQRKLLRLYQGTLRTIAEDIDRLNRNNSELMNLSLNSIEGSIRFVNRLISSAGTYAGTGEIRTIQSSGRLLSTEG